MQQSSNSIGALAAALAKAQSEIVNPEKSLTATIAPAQGPRELTRSGTGTLTSVPPLALTVCRSTEVNVANPDRTVTSQYSTWTGIGRPFWSNS